MRQSWCPSVRIVPTSLGRPASRVMAQELEGCQLCCTKKAPTETTHLEIIHCSWGAVGWLMLVDSTAVSESGAMWSSSMSGLSSPRAHVVGRESDNDAVAKWAHLGCTVPARELGTRQQEVSQIEKKESTRQRVESYLIQLSAPNVHLQVTGYIQDLFVHEQGPQQCPFGAWHCSWWA